MANEVRSDDADIDALMGSVVGGNGQVIEFPTAPARAAKQREKATPRQATLAATSVETMSGELATQLEANQPRPIIDPRTVPVRFSNLKHMARSALHYWDAVQLDREDTLAMRIGRGAHAMVLGEPVVKWVGKTRQGKAWEAFRALHADKEILNAKEWATAEGIANAIRRHPIAAPLLFEGTILEQTIEWEWLGRKCTSRPDSRRGGQVVTDLKTTQCADPERFRFDALKRAYHAQLAFYGLATKHLTGVEPDDLFACAVESKRPFAVTVLRLTDEARTQGEKMARLWFERLLVCESSDSWPAYTDAIVKLDAPSDGDPDAAIDLDDLPEELFA